MELTLQRNEVHRMVYSPDMPLYIGAGENLIIRAAPRCTIEMSNIWFTDAPIGKESHMLQIDGLVWHTCPCTIKLSNLRFTSTVRIKNLKPEDQATRIVEDMLSLIGVQAIDDRAIEVTNCTFQGQTTWTGGHVICDRLCAGAHIHHNHLSGFNNYGAAIAGGCNNYIYDNDLDSPGARVGVYCHDFYTETKDPFVGNVVVQKRSRRFPGMLPNRVNCLTPFWS